MSEELNTAGEFEWTFPLVVFPDPPFSSTIDSLYNGKKLTLFPGHSQLQFLIACSKQKQRGKAWEI